jgi:hypothetical protein
MGFYPCLFTPISVVNLTLLYINSKSVIPANTLEGTGAGIQPKNTGFPRIKYGAGSIKPGMTIKVKTFLNHCISYLISNGVSNGVNKVRFNF